MPAAMNAHTEQQLVRYVKLAAHLFARLESHHHLRMIDDGEGEQWDTLELAEQFDALIAKAEQA